MECNNDMHGYVKIHRSRTIGVNRDVYIKQKNQVAFLLHCVLFYRAMLSRVQSILW